MTSATSRSIHASLCATNALQSPGFETTLSVIPLDKPRRRVDLLSGCAGAGWPIIDPVSYIGFNSSSFITPITLARDYVGYYSAISSWAKPTVNNATSFASYYGIVPQNRFPGLKGWHGV